VYGAWAGVSETTDGGERLDLHASFCSTALLVQLIEACGEHLRGGWIIAQQALNTDRHVVHTTGRVQAWGYRESEIGRG
jgi:hypothetical protein